LPGAVQVIYDRKKSLPTEPAIEGNKRHAEIASRLLEATIDQSGFGDRLKNFCRHILKSPTAVEREFELDFITNRVIGKIDAFSIHGNQAVIVDWKGYPGYNEDLQLKIYSLAVRELYPEVEVCHGYFFFTGPDYYEPHSYFLGDLNAFSGEVARIIDTISDDQDFKPCPGPHCSRCAFSERCEVAANFSIVKMESLSEVIEAARRIFAAEAMVEKIKERVKAWMADHGVDVLPIDSDNKYYLSPSISFRNGKIKSEKEREACEKIIQIAISESQAPSLNKITNSESADGKIIQIGKAVKSLKEKIKMSDLADMMKAAGLLSSNATNADASGAIRDRLGTNFIMATEDQKIRLYQELTDLLERKAG